MDFLCELDVIMNSSHQSYVVFLLLLRFTFQTYNDQSQVESSVGSTCTQGQTGKETDIHRRGDVLLLHLLLLNLIDIAQFDTNGILTALYIVKTYIQM